MARIIVIGDEQGERTLLRSHLEWVGHNVTEASDGIVALAAFDRQSYDLIIVYVLMPEEDSIVVAKLLPKLQPEAKVMAIAGSDPNPSSDWAQDMIQTFGAHVVLEKPFGKDEFLDNVNRLLSMKLKPRAFGT